VAQLKTLFHELDGKRAPTPCDDVEPLTTYGETPTIIRVTPSSPSTRV
jgi:hypothetical protein